MQEERDDDDQRGSGSEQGGDDHDDDQDFGEFRDLRVKDLVLKQFNAEQKERFHKTIENKIDKGEYNKIKEFASTILPGITVGKTARMILATAAKIYAGEIVEEARRLMTEKGETRDNNPIDPEYIREAYRKLKAQQIDDKFTESDILYF